MAKIIKGIRTVNFEQSFKSVVWRFEMDLREEIIKMYDNGHTYREIIDKLKTNCSFISKNVKGRRSKEKINEVNKSHRSPLSEETLKKLSEFGKRACINSKKIWTRPEKLFYEILKEMNIGVKFNEELREITKENGDENGEIFFQFPIQRYLCDFVHLEKKIVFMINGDFWHGNPILYTEDKLTKIQKFNIGRDRNKKIYLEKNAWKICDVWESEIYWNKELVKERVLEFLWAERKRVNPSVLHAEVAQFESESAHQIKNWEENLKKIWFKEPKIKIVKEKRECLVCKNSFEAKSKKQKVCSPKCSSLLNRKVERPNKEALEQEIRTMSMVSLGKKYKVSDNTVKKWAKSYGIL